MYGLDLFSGIGGITKALDGYVRPVAYCENDRYAQGVLLSRMWSGEIPCAPIWDDVRTLRGLDLQSAPVDIIYGGFPCQDISVAGRGAGLAGKRSGLFFEIVRLIGEIRPDFVFLENVPAIRTRGGDVVGGELARLGYDSRWCTLSAADVGANHRRERWWLLAHASGARPGRIESRDATGFSGPRGSSEDVANAKSGPMRDDSQNIGEIHRKINASFNASLFGRKEEICNPAKSGLSDGAEVEVGQPESVPQSKRPDWWSVEPDVGRVAHGVPLRVDRLRGLGNAVVPAQAREAFERLIGLK